MKLFWMVFVLALVAALLALSLAPVPIGETVDSEVVGRFYSFTWIAGALCGLVCGFVLGVLSVSAVRHREDEAASDFDDRVALRGLLGAGIAALAAVVVTLLIGALFPMGESAGDQLKLVFSSLLISVSPLCAAVAAMFVYAFATRARTWGGTFSLMRR